MHKPQYSSFISTHERRSTIKPLRGGMVLLISGLLLFAVVGCSANATATSTINSTPNSTTSNSTPTALVTPDVSNVTNPTSTNLSTSVTSHNNPLANLQTSTVTSLTPTTPSSFSATTSTPLSSTSVVPSGNLETDVRNIVDAVKPAVVLIAVTTPQAQGVGTGSIITQDGFILTNFHVVAADAATVSSQTTIRVVLTNGKKYPARLVGTDRGNDLAVVKIDATNLPIITQGNSANLHVGDWVVAVGNALALPGGPTVTAGIVGALGRSLQEPPPAGADLTELIQTNAAINPGNSGGPLLNLKGELVGINTAAAVDPQSQSAAQGIGFAISIDQAKPIIQTLMSGKSIVAPYMGILPQTLTPGLAAQFNLATDTGVLIRQVGIGTPAAQAGWKSGDILTSLDGTQLTSVADLQGVINKHQPQDSVAFTLITPQGQTQHGTITFGSPPNQ